MIYALITTLLILLATPLSFAAAAESSTPADVVRSASPQIPDASSDKQAEAVLRHLLATSGNFPNAQVSVNQGTVLIEGVIPDEKDLVILEKAAEKIPAVVAVVNKAKMERRDLIDLSPAIQESQKLFDRMKRFIPAILTALILIAFLLVVGKAISHLNRKFWSRRIANPFLQATVSRLSLWPLWIVFFYVTLQAAGLSGLATTIIGGTGVLGIVLGLAFKGIFENYLAGLLLATRAPFTRGDLIIVNDQYKGYVQNLNMRGTTIIDLSGHLILIPNSTVITSVVENQTANPKIRTEFIIAISYADAISRAQDLLVEALKTVRGALPDPPPDVIVEEFTSSAVKLRVRVWFNVKETNEPRFRSRAMALTKETLLANGLSIPAEIKELVFNEPLRVRVLESKEEAATVVREKKDQVIETAAGNLKSGHTRAHQPEDQGNQANEMLKLASENPLMQDYDSELGYDPLKRKPLESGES